MSKSQSPHKGSEKKRRRRRGGSNSSRKDGARDRSKGSKAADGHSARHSSSKKNRKPSGRTGSEQPLSGGTGSIKAGNTGSARRVSAGNTGSAKRVSAGSTGSAKRVSAGNTGSLSATGSKRIRSSSGTARPSKRGKYAPMHAAPVKKRSHVGRVLLIILLVAGVGVGAFFGVRYLLNPYEGAKVEDGKQVSVVIPDGSSGSEIVQALLDAGVIHSSKDFRKAVQQQNADQSLRSGTYTFVTGTSCSDIVRQLVAGPNSVEGQLQVPEGLTITQTANLVESSLGIPSKEFLEQAKASKYADDYPFLASAGKDSLEGYLYPKTYDLSGKEKTADAVIRLMLDQFQSEVNGLDMAAAEKKLADRYNLNVTDYDILKIASIIEKEATNEDDRPKVSSVFYNRLSVGKALESDATMGYETGGAATSEDLTKESPYNTYLHKGLPPTPICSPSLWNIQAAMEPADTDYMYFFIIEDDNYSKHTYSKTYEEHDSAYAEALKEQAAANGEKK